MVSKSRAHAGILLVLLFFVTICGYLVFTKHYLFALISLGGIMFSVKARMHLGYRGPRRALFAMHLACNSMFLLSLVLLIFSAPFFWLTPLLHVSFVGMVITGAALVKQSWNYTG